MKKIICSLLLLFPLLSWGQTTDAKATKKEKFMIGIEPHDLLAGSLSLNLRFPLGSHIYLNINPSYSFPSYAFSDYKVNGGGSNIALQYIFNPERKYSLYSSLGAGMFYYNINGYNSYFYDDIYEHGEAQWIDDTMNGAPILRYAFYDKDFDRFVMLNVNTAFGCRVRINSHMRLLTELGLQYQHALENAKEDQDGLIGLHRNVDGLVPTINVVLGFTF